MKKQGAAERTVNTDTQERCAKITTKKNANGEKTVQTTTQRKTAHTGSAATVTEDTTAH